MKLDPSNPTDKGPLVTSTLPTKTTRSLKLMFGFCVAVFLLLTVVPAPSADALPPIDMTSRFTVVTQDCVAPYQPAVDENGSRICWDANPYGDGVYGDQGAFGCSTSVAGRTVYRDVDEGYSLDHYPYIEVLYGCYYYPGVTFLPTYTTTFSWSPPTYSYTWNS